MFIDDDYDIKNHFQNFDITNNLKIFKSSNSTSYLKIAKSQKDAHVSLFDTGASRSGTHDEKLLTNIEKCNNITVQGAFGPPFRPALKGRMGPLELETVVIPDMNETLLSVYQICNGSSS